LVGVTTSLWGAVVLAAIAGIVAMFLPPVAATEVSWAAHRAMIEASSVDTASRMCAEFDMPDLPIVCTLTPDALRARPEGLLAALLRQSTGYELLPEGLRLRSAPSTETLASIPRGVEAERHCCRFLRFTITVEPNEGPLTLDLIGLPGTREFVVALLEA
jgi:hypothetical protein